jgi:hypothetical protein
MRVREVGGWLFGFMTVLSLGCAGDSGGGETSTSGVGGESDGSGQHASSGGSGTGATSGKSDGGSSDGTGGDGRSSSATGSGGNPTGGSGGSGGSSGATSCEQISDAVAVELSAVATCETGDECEQVFIGSGCSDSPLPCCGFPIRKGADLSVLSQLNDSYQQQPCVGNTIACCSCAVPPALQCIEGHCASG